MKQYKVIYEENSSGGPWEHERKAAEFLANYFQSNIIFMKRGLNRTPDLYIETLNRCYELKSPIGKGKHTIQNNLRAAASQSENIIVDLGRSRSSDETNISKIQFFLAHDKNHIKRLLVITSQQKVIKLR